MLVLCLIFTAILGVLAVVLAASLIIVLNESGLPILKTVLLFLIFILTCALIGLLLAETVLLIFR